MTLPPPSAFPGRPLPECRPISRRSALAKRPSGGDFWRPPARRHSIVENASWDAVRFGDFRPCAAFGSAMHDAAVSGLHLHGRPDAVPGVVSLVVIGALNGQVVGITTGQRPRLERLKGRPLTANGDPFAEIAFLCWTRAARVHVLPDGVEPRGRLPMRCPAGADGCARALTATRDAFSTSEVGAHHRLLGAAGTSRQPQSTAALRVPSLCQNGPPAVAKARHIDESRV